MSKSIRSNKCIYVFDPGLQAFETRKLQETEVSLLHEESTQS